MQMSSLGDWFHIISHHLQVSKYLLEDYIPSSVMFNWDMNHPLFWESTRSISRGWILVPRSGAAIGGCRIYVKVCMIRSRSTTVPGMEKPNCFPVFKESPPKISLIGPDLKKMRHRNDASEDLTGCWFQTCLEFSISYMGQSFPLTFIFFKMVKTTNECGKPDMKLVFPNWRCMTGR